MENEDCHGKVIESAYFTIIHGILLVLSLKFRRLRISLESAYFCKLL